MRPIDADALPSALFQKHVHDEEELEPMLYFEDAVKVVEDAPTIDAIPIAWLEAQIVPFSDKLKDEVKGVFNATIREMIYRWRQEQEAE